MQLEQKYQVLIQTAQARHVSDVAGIELCFRLLSLSAAIDRDCAVRLAPYGLSEGRFILLTLLATAPDGLAPKTLALRAGITRATVTGLLDGLEREGLVVRQADQGDRRALCIRLTAQGQDVAARVLEEHTHWIASLFAPLSADQRQQLSDLLTQVATDCRGDSV